MLKTVNINKEETKPEEVKNEEPKNEEPKKYARSGALKGIESVEDMTDDQLAIEIRNANSNYVKAKERGSEAAMARNKKRLEVAKAERAKRKPVKEEKTDKVVENVKAEGSKNSSIPF